MKTALFPGTFDPFTLGHSSLVNRGLQLFDQIIVAVGFNNSKKSFFTPEERLQQISACFVNEPRVVVKSYEGMTVDFAIQEKADVILRGVRTLSDFEYERLLSEVNLKISNIDTVFLFSEPAYSMIQSSVVRELLNFNQDISSFVPAAVLALMKK